MPIIWNSDCKIWSIPRKWIKCQINLDEQASDTPSQTERITKACSGHCHLYERMDFFARWRHIVPTDTWETKPPPLLGRSRIGCDEDIETTSPMLLLYWNYYWAGSIKTLWTMNRHLDCVNPSDFQAMIQPVGVMRTGQAQYSRKLFQFEYFCGPMHEPDSKYFPIRRVKVVNMFSISSFICENQMGTAHNAC